MKTPAHAVLALLISLRVLAALLCQPAVALANSELSRPPDGIGPDYRSWSVHGPFGTGAPASQVVEIATGMNFFDPVSQQWTPSEPVFQVSAAGNTLIATRVQHPVTLSAELNVLSAVSLLTPDGQRVSSTPVGIALYDRGSGVSRFVGRLTNCPALLVGPNQVLYEDAFAGICASVLYTIDRGSFSQDIILTAAIDPATFGFPADTTQIQVWTELYDAPQPDILSQPVFVEEDPVKRLQMATPDVVDETIGFGDYVLAAGRAFLTPDLSRTNGTIAPVSKQLKSAFGRTFLVESVDYPVVREAMARLPQCLSAGGLSQAAPERRAAGLYVSNRSESEPPRPGGVVRDRAVPVASHGAKPSGLILDYIGTIGGTIATNLTLASDVTYFVSGQVNCNGNVTLEPAVLKYAAGASIQLNNTLTCKTSQYRPAIFTAEDDDSVGDSLRGMTNYTGIIQSNGYASPAIYTAAISVSLSNCWFRYARTAIEHYTAGNSTVLNLTHSQLFQCICGIDLQSAGTGTGPTRTVNMGNGLVAGVSQPFYGSSAAAPLGLSLANCTVDQAGQLVYGGTSNSTLSAWNSVFANVTNATSVACGGGNNGFYRASPGFGSGQISVSTSPFQVAGAGNYYLGDGSPFRNAGSATAISASLQADLARRTTYPPIIIAQTVYNANRCLSPQAQRDADTPDLGYHYDPLDYALSGVLVTNALLTVTNGAAVAFFGASNASYGLCLGQAGALLSQGGPRNLNWFVLYNLVQEQPTNGWCRTTNGLVISEFQGLNPGSSVCCRFTSWSVPVQDAPAFYAPTNAGPFTFQDCEFHGGNVVSWRPTLELTNCLFERVSSDIEPHDGNVANVRNCEIYGGTFKVVFTNTAAWLADNLFDQATVINSNNAYNGYNAYVTNGFTTANLRLLPANSNDILLSAPFAYQTGPLGTYYQLINSVLIDSGNTWAASVGLFHYTVTTNLVNGLETKEGSTKVDLGHHYVATDSLGNPIDSNADGTADYISDLNGNGAVDSGEVAWNVAGDVGLKVRITRPNTTSVVP